MKLFIWNDPYRVSWGNSIVFAVADTLEEAKMETLKGRVCKFGEDYGQPAPDYDWRKQIKLGEPTRILDFPCAEWHEWSE